MKNLSKISMLIISGLILNINCLFAQCSKWDWVNQISSQGEVYVKDVCADSSGNIYVIGSGDVNTKINNFISKYPIRGEFIAKIKSDDGTVVWLKNISGFSTWNGKAAIKVDNKGYIYTVGEYNDDYGSGINYGDTVITSSKGTHGAYIAKIDTSGHLKWIHLDKNNANKIISGVDISVDNIGNVNYIGDFAGTMNMGDTILYPDSGASEIYFAQFDINGKFKWVKYIKSSSYCFPGTIMTDNNGDIFIAGSFQANAKFNDTLQIKTSSMDFFLAKYTNKGQFLWLKQGASISAFDKDEKGNLYLLGYYKYGMTIDDTTLINNTGKYTTFLAKLNTSGKLLWLKEKKTNTDQISKDLIVANSNKITITGIYVDSIILGDTTLYAQKLKAQSYIAEYNLDGDFIWANQVQGISGRDFTKISKDKQGNIYFITGFKDTVYLANKMLFSAVQNGLVAKYCPPPAPIINSVNKENELNTEFKIYPNPFSDKTMIQFSIPEKSEIKLELYNIVGKQIETIFEGNVEENKIYTLEYNAKNLPAGVYFYKLSSNLSVWNKKVVVIK